MPTEKTIARTLRRENRKHGRSWRVIAREDYHGAIAPGTLARIASTRGEYFPSDANLRRVLGAPVKVCSTCHRKVTVPRTTRVKRWSSLDDLSSTELAYALSHREVMS
jgi:hypothetical protein